MRVCNSKRERLIVVRATLLNLLYIALRDSVSVEELKFRQEPPSRQHEPP